MNRFIVAALAVCLAALPALADESPKDGKPHGPDPKQMAAKMAEHLAKDLALSEEQSKQVSAILDQRAAERAELMKKMREHELKTHEAIRAVLNDDQKEKFDVMRARKMMGQHGMGAGMRGDRPPHARGHAGGPEGDDAPEGAAPPPSGD